MSDLRNKKQREKRYTEKTGSLKVGNVPAGGEPASGASRSNNFATAHKVAEDKEKRDKLNSFIDHARETRRRRAADLADPQRKQKNEKALKNFKKQRTVNQAFIRMGHPEEADKGSEMDYAYDYVPTDQERQSYSRRKRVQEAYRKKNQK